MVVKTASCTKLYKLRRTSAISSIFKKTFKKNYWKIWQYVFFFHLIMAFVRKTFLLVCNIQKIVDQPFLINRVKVQIRPEIWDIETYKNNLENEIFQNFIIWIKHWTRYLLLLLFLLDACHFLYKCNNHGTCKNDGSCQCDPGFYSNDCSGKFSKAIYDWGWYLLLVLC